MKKSIVRIEWPVFLLAGICSMANQSWAVTINATSCSQSAVQTAINSASDGDKVMVPAGNCTWSATVNITNKTITLQGAGSGSGGTKITYGGSGHEFISINAGSKTGKMDLSGFWFTGGDTNYYGGLITFSGPVGWKNLRIHHNVFENSQRWTLRGSAATYGLIDHNTFQGIGFGVNLSGRGDTDWSSPLTLGTSDFFFIEDNTFNWDDWYGNTGVPANDMENGGRLVFRNNNLRYSFFQTHDKVRNGFPSANAWEVYNNVFWTNTDKWKGIDITAGTGVIWGNVFTGNYSYPIGAMDYKTGDPRSLHVCDGSDPADQNVPGEAGWRCQYQIGSQGKGATAVGNPAYVWSNTKSDVSVGMQCTLGCQYAGRPHLKEGRDYFNNGTTPKPGYIPYTYPHPLTQSGSITGLSPVKNLHIL